MHISVSNEIRDNYHELARNEVLRKMASETSHFLNMGIVTKQYLESWEFMFDSNKEYAERNGTVQPLTIGSVAKAIRLVLTEYEIEEGE